VSQIQERLIAGICGCATWTFCHKCRSKGNIFEHLRQLIEQGTAHVETRRSLPASRLAGHRGVRITSTALFHLHSPMPLPRDARASRACSDPVAGERGGLACFSNPGRRSRVTAVTHIPGPGLQSLAPKGPRTSLRAVYRSTPASREDDMGHGQNGRGDRE
jgi:hypothetical protein